MPKKKSHGGPREGSGRKPIEDKVIALTIYPRESWVKKIGKAKAQEAAKQAIKDVYNFKVYEAAEKAAVKKYKKK